MSVRLALFVLITCCAALLQTAPSRATACQGPYHTVSPDGRCVWSCGAGTRPDASRNACVCQDGHSPNGTDRFGRLRCAAGNAQLTPIPLPVPPAIVLPPPQATHLADDHPFNTDPHRLCSTYGRAHNDTGHPYRCRTAAARPVLFFLPRAHVIAVFKERPLASELRRQGRFRILFPRPADPPRNADCSENATGVRGSCAPTCYRVEYLTFTDAGGLRGLLRATGRQADVCDRDFTGDIELGRPSAALAYDACSREARVRNVRRWNFDIDIRVPKRVAAAYGFKDAHTTGRRGNWQYHLQIQHVFVEDRVEMPVRVECR